MKPSKLEISLKVMRSINDADRMSDKQWLLSIEHAQYEAERAERQFMLADPENRLVVRSPESNWNQKLKELEKTKQDYAIYSSKKAWVPSEKEEQDILNLAQKIPEIWNAPVHKSTLHMILFSNKPAAFTIAGGSIPKQRWEVCSMKSPWEFRFFSLLRLAWVSPPS